MFYLDFVRAVALAAILVIHFNATVTGYFTLPYKLFGSVLPFGIYLGDFGSSLFFMVSGASLALTVPEKQHPLDFYKKRAAAIYPLFWLAWAICFSLRFVSKPGSFAGAKTITLLLTFTGLDHFAVAAGWVGMDFACVGEWFLGSILFIYLLFPLLQRGLEKRTGVTVVLALALCLPVQLAGWDAHLVSIHVLEFMFGMLYLRLPRNAKMGLCLVCAAAVPVLQSLDSKITCALFSVAAFTVLAGLSRWLDRPWPRTVCAKAAKLSYAVFLVHHVLIQRLAEKLDLVSMSRRDTALLFLVYLASTWAAAEALLALHRHLKIGWASFRPSDS